jgi:hypothetical protein
MHSRCVLCPCSRALVLTSLAYTVYISHAALDGGTFALGTAISCTHETSKGAKCRQLIELRGYLGTQQERAQGTSLTTRLVRFNLLQASYEEVRTKLENKLKFAPKRSNMTAQDIDARVEVRISAC